MNVFTTNPKKIDNSYSISKIMITIFLISLFLIPFDDLPYFPMLGGLGKRASIYAFSILVFIAILIFIKNKKIFFINTIENYLILAFYSSCILSIIINFSSISESLFKGQSGFKRVIIQLASITLLLLTFYTIQFIVNKCQISIFTIRKYICLSFIPVGIVATLQLLNLLKLFDFSYIISKISYIVNSSLRGDLYGTRIRGVSAEASYLGMYCAFVFPWFFSYLLTAKKRTTKICFAVISFIILALVVGTKSRTAVILTLLDIIVIGFLIIFLYKNVKTKILSSLTLIFMTIFLFNFSSLMDLIINRPISQENTNIEAPSNTVNNYEVGGLISSISDNTIDSNIARSSMQKAALNIGIDNPIIGVGLGQFGFYVNDYIPEGAKENSYEVRNWIDTTVSVWPPVHSLYHRIFAEEGIIGLILYFSFIVTVCLRLFIKIIASRDDKTKCLIGIILLSSYSSILVGGLTLDQFVIPQFWIMSAICVLYNSNLLKINFNINK